MNKQQKLNVIAQSIVKCRECKKRKSGKAVPGEGNPNADIVFLGEAPGRLEAASGRPFVGRSGQLLRKKIREAGFIENDVYITSAVKYLPNYGTPTKKDIRHGKIHLDKQFAVIEPKVIVLLGATAAYAMLEKSLPVLQMHGKVMKKDGRWYLITLHPAAVLRFPRYAAYLDADFKKITTIISRSCKNTDLGI